MLFLCLMFFTKVSANILVVFTLLSLSGLGQTKEIHDAKTVATKMVKAIHDVQRLKYSLKIIERGSKGYNHYESSVKINRKPRKLQHPRPQFRLQRRPEPRKENIWLK